jgi:hypothetical protein
MSKILTLDFDFRFLFQFGIGPAFKYAITNKLDIHFGTGFHLSMLSTNINRIIIGSRVQISSLSLSLGIMGDIGVIYKITDMFW